MKDNHKSSIFILTIIFRDIEYHATCA